MVNKYQKIVVYHLLKTSECYKELGVDYFDKRDRERFAKNLLGRLEDLGYGVTIRQATQSRDIFKTEAMLVGGTT